MKTLYYISVFLHILAAMTWIGGMIFFAVVVVPIIRKPELKSMATKLVDWTGRRFSIVGWVSLSTLVVTGSYNLIYRFGWRDFIHGTFFHTAFGYTMAYKLIFVVIVLLISAYHDFQIGPKATALREGTLSPQETEKIRKQASMLGRLNLLFSFVILFFAISLIRGLPW